MPFIGRDWRSPGEQWVKTHQGSWERLKLLEHRLHQHGFHSGGDSSTESDCSDNDESAPCGSDCECKSNNSSSPNSSSSPSSSGAESPLSSSPDSLPTYCPTASNSTAADTQATVDSSQTTDLTGSGASSAPIQIRTLGCTGVRHRATRFESIQNIILQLQRPQVRESFGSNSAISLSGRPLTPRPLALRPELPEMIRQQLSTNKWRRTMADVSAEGDADFATKTEVPPVISGALIKVEDELMATSAPVAKSNLIVSTESVHDPNWCVRQHMQRLRRAQQQIKQHLEFDVAMDSVAIDSSFKCFLAKSHKSHSSSPTKNSTPPPTPQQQPHCPITLKCTREVAAYNTISEAFHRLDFCNAIRDIRRFNYICKLLHLLITQNLTSLSGCATKFLFNLLEQVAWQVASSQQNIHILHTLLHDLKKIMKKYYCWGRPLGSTLLWEQHLLTIEKICQLADKIEIKQPTDQGARFTDLPEELIRAILLRLSDYKDLMNSGQACERIRSLLEEQHIWRELCRYHFTSRQIKQIVNGQSATQRLSDSRETNWEQVFHNLRKQFGLKEEYADSLFLCRHCRCLFWKTCGHPCLYLSTTSSDTTDSSNKENRNNSDQVSRLVNAQQVVAMPIPIQQPQPHRAQPQAAAAAAGPIGAAGAQVHPWQALFAHRNRLLAQQQQRQQQQQLEEEEEERFEYKVPDCIPISPEAFLKFFSL